VLYEVCNACADRRPEPRLRCAGAAVRVAIDRDKLAMAVTHAVRNAQDATPPDGRIDVRLGVEAQRGRIEVEDNGSGMAPDFVRDHLFKPFDSTKGAKGMGIGAYQIRETLRAAGGDVEVQSEPGNGTLLRMSLPLAAVDILEAACE
jgi:signal transduction histidine kinase